MNADEFLEFLFQGVKEDEVIVVCGDGARSQRSKAKKNTSWTARRWVPGELNERPGRTYFGISTVTPGADGSIGFHGYDLKFCYVIAVDDIGTKVSWEKAAGLPAPNIKLKTSNVAGDQRGNQQWFYALAYPADPARAAALIDGLVAAGMTDEGTDRANRWMRIPGSINLKNGEVFAAEVIDEGCTDECMSLAELEVALKPLGVVSSELRDALEPIVPLEDELADPVFRWLLASPKSPLKQPATKANNGWYAVHCPWEDEHESGTGGGADYLPGTGFKCLHGTCKKNGRNVQAFRLWCLEQDPEAGFTAERDLFEAVDTLSIGAELSAALDDAVERPANDEESVRFSTPEERGPSPEQAARHFMIDNYIHVEVQNKYWSVKSRGLVERGAVDDRMTAMLKRTTLLHTYSAATGNQLKDMPVSAWMRIQPDLPRVANLTHRLGQPLIVDGYLNIAPAIPPRELVVGEPEPWLDLVDFICRTDDHADQVLDWMALVVTAWDEKPGWHLLIKGPPGAGKDLMLSPLVSYLAPAHWYGLTVKNINSDFTPFLARRLIMIDELKMTTRGEATPHDIYNVIKAWTARGTRWVMINEKNVKPYEALDLSCWAPTSNAEVPLPIEDGDRRWNVIETPRIIRSKEYYMTLVKWLEAGGWKMVIAWLQRRWDAMSEERRDLVRGTAPISEAKRELIINSAEGIEGAVRLSLSGPYSEDWPDLMRVDDVQAKLSNSDLMSEQARRSLTRKRVAMALKAAGAVQLFDGEQIEDSAVRRRMRLWCMRVDKVKAYESLGQGKALIDEYDRQRGGAGPSMAFKKAHLTVVPSDK